MIKNYNSNTTTPKIQYFPSNIVIDVQQKYRHFLHNIPTKSKFDVLKCLDKLEHNLLHARLSDKWLVAECCLRYITETVGKIGKIPIKSLFVAGCAYFMDNIPFRDISNAFNSSYLSPSSVLLYYQRMKTLAFR